MALKELFAYYDPVKDKIVNTNKYSLAWWHEKGHQVQRKKDKLSKAQLLIDTFAICIILRIAMLLKDFWIAIILIIIAFILLILEIDAWIYAFKHYKGG